MNTLVNLEKLEELKRQGKIGEAEFEEQKRLLFRRSMRESGEHANPKSGIVYILLAWFLGAVGVHNFYAGYWRRATVQLLMALFAPLFLFVPLLLSALWAFAELLLQNKSRGGRKFGGNRKVIFILRIGAVVWFAAAVSSASFVEFDLMLPELPDDAVMSEFY